MSFAYLPLFTGDYLRDTRHLTPLKHGVFLLALMHCWDSKGPMPLDEQECAGICNCRSADEVEAMRYVLGRFFTRMEDGHYNHRMQKEVERSEQISGARSEAGRKGYEARAKHLPSKSQAIAKQVHLSPSPSPSPSLPPSPENIEPTALVVSAAPNRPPACPTDKIVALYHKRLPMLPSVAVLTDARKRSLSARWRDVVSGDKMSAQEGEEFFDWFFAKAAESAFLTGRVEAQKGRRPFRASLDWLMSPTYFPRVVEGQYK